MQNKIYYNYALLDPRKPGNYEYKISDSEVIKFKYEPFYIGKGKNRRIKDHFWDFENQDNNFKWNVIKRIEEIGLQVISIKIIENLCENVALENEKRVIKLIGRRNLNLGPLANLTDGGDGVSGYKATPEQIEANRLRNLGRKLKQSTKNKISKAHTGKKKSKEHCENIRKARIGTKRSIETCEKMSRVRSKKIPLQFDSITNKLLKEWKNIKEAADYFNCSTQLIRYACKDSKNFAKGYKWKYKEIC